MPKLKTTTDLVTVAPTGPTCLKCGTVGKWTGPVYQHGKRVTVKRVASPHAFANTILDTTESLVYTCSTCGYQRHDPCKDTQ